MTCRTSFDKQITKFFWSASIALTKILPETSPIADILMLALFPGAKLLLNTSLKYAIRSLTSVFSPSTITIFAEGWCFAKYFAIPLINVKSEGTIESKYGLFSNVFVGILVTAITGTLLLFPHSAA